MIDKSKILTQKKSPTSTNRFDASVFATHLKHVSPEVSLSILLLLKASQQKNKSSLDLDCTEADDPLENIPILRSKL
jgi:hypothetical protein